MENIEFERLNSSDPKIKYGYTKELIRIGKENPALLYPHFDRFITLLTINNNIIKWMAIDVIGYMSSIDKENKIGPFIPTLIKHLHGGHLITCNHAISTLGLIARYKPQYRAKIVPELLSISRDTFDNEECKNIAIGKTIDTITPIITEINADKTVLDFVKKATKNTRNATSKKAIKLLNILAGAWPL